MKSKKLLIPSLVIAVAALLMVVSLFLPILSVNKEYKEKLDKAEGTVVELFGEDTKAEELKSISMVKFAKLMNAKEEASGGDTIASTVLTVMNYLIAGFAVVTLVVGLIRLPVVSIITDLVSTGFFTVYLLLLMEGINRAKEVYHLGFAGYFFFIVAAIALVASVWLLIAKKKYKKEKAEKEKKEEAEKK